VIFDLIPQLKVSNLNINICDGKAFFIEGLLVSVVLNRYENKAIFCRVKCISAWRIWYSVKEILVLQTYSQELRGGGGGGGGGIWEVA
jgi:hypothetical protein